MHGKQTASVVAPVKQTHPVQKRGIIITNIINTTQIQRNKQGFQSFTFKNKSEELQCFVCGGGRDQSSCCSILDHRVGTMTSLDNSVDLLCTICKPAWASNMPKPVYDM